MNLGYIHSMNQNDLLSIKLTTHTAFSGVYVEEILLSDSSCRYQSFKGNLQNENALLETSYLSTSQVNELKGFLRKIELPVFPKIGHLIFDGNSYLINIKSMHFDLEMGFSDGFGQEFKSINNLLSFIHGLQQFDT